MAYANWLPALRILLLLAVTKGLLGIRLVKLNVPGTVSRGTPVWLFCHYELEQDMLYSVKWYKNHVEFYRFQPSDAPPGQNYALPGVQVDLTQSNASHVYLYTTDFLSEGVYRCEVSAEAPSFKTVSAEKEMYIYELPEDGLVIDGLQPSYEVGDILNLTCKSGPSRPPVTLEWRINGLDVSAELVDVKVEQQGQTRDSLQTSFSQLNMELEGGHFWRGMLKVRCLATLRQKESTRSQELVVPDSTLWVSPYQLSHIAPGQVPPHITGVAKRYDIGDLLEVNCSADSAAPLQLKWTINGHDVKPNHLIHYPLSYTTDGREVSTLGLQVTLHGRHFKNQESRLKCVATGYSILRMSTDATVIGENQQSSELRVSDTVLESAVRASGGAVVLTVRRIVPFLVAFLAMLVA